MGARGGDSSGPLVGKYEWVPRQPPHLPLPVTPNPTLAYSKDVAKD